MKKKKSLIYPVIFMLVLAFILTFILAAFNGYTKSIVEFNKDIELKSKILYVFDVKVDSESPEAIDKAFKEYVTEEDYKGKRLFTHVKDGSPLAYAVPFDGPGLWGSIDGYVGIDKDLKTITGVDFIKQDETPGLGGRIEESPYKEQYRGVDVSKPVDNKLVINRPQTGGNIDAITGATQTSTFVMNMVNEDLMEFIESKKGAK